MNLTRCFYRVLRVGDLFSSNYNTWGTNSLIFKEKNKSTFLFNLQKPYCKISTPEKKVALLPKKRPSKRRIFSPGEGGEGLRITAVTTAEEYDLEELTSALPRLTKFEASTFGSDFRTTIDVVHARKTSETGPECQDLFFFREGCVVLWNFQDSEIKSILNFLKHFEDNSFVDDLVKNEQEVLSYSVSSSIAESQFHKDCIILSTKDDNLLEKYAISNAMALSVHLGAYEANLDQYIQTMEPVTEDLKAGNKIKMTRSEVLQKTGQLFALRHNINLNSDLLDTPDFYWDREELESLYQTTFNYYCISKRTKVINEKINHCIELVELLSSHLNDKHHVRLEWMIIILIMVEVAFEMRHYLERYIESQEK